MGETPRFWIAFGVLLSTLAICTIVTLTMTIRAHADQATCVPYKELQAALAEKYHEEPSGAGLAQEGKFAWTIFTSPKGESWTMVILDATGKACVVETGKNWVDLSPGKGDPT